MILQKLCELAYRERLLADPDYEPKPVAGILVVRDGGELVRFLPTTSLHERGKRIRGKVIPIPRRCGRTKGVVPDFLVDKSQYVLGIEPATSPTPKGPAELLERLNSFRDSVRAASLSTGVPALGAVCAFLANDSERARAAEEMSMAGYMVNDLFAFEHDGQLVHEIPEVRRYFSEIRRATSVTGVACLVCGRVSAPVTKHPVVKIPGGSTSGVALVSFNSDAFESYGLARNHNAPVCRDCADAYTSALSRLLDVNYPDPRKPGKTLPKRFVRLSQDTTALFWSEGESRTIELLADFLAARPESVQELFDAPTRGYMPGQVLNRFYCLIISGAQGRATVRSMHEGTIEQFECNIHQYFRQVTIGSEPPFPLWRLLGSLVLRDEWETLPPGIGGDLFQAIVFGKPFSRSLLSRAVARCGAERKVTSARAALIRGVLIRNSGNEVSVSLDTEKKDAGYRLGRLLAVLERLQYAAQGNPDRTIVDHYYGAASTRPVVVFPRLIALAQHHLSKLTVASQIYFQRLMGAVLEDMTGFRPTLTLEEQGQFAIGYYHQRQDFFRKPTNDQPGSPSEQKQ